RPVIATVEIGVPGVRVSNGTIWLAVDSPKAVAAAAGVATTPSTQNRVAAIRPLARSPGSMKDERMVAMAILRRPRLHGFAAAALHALRSRWSTYGKGIRVAVAALPAAQKTPPAFEYIARS